MRHQGEDDGVSLLQGDLDTARKVVCQPRIGHERFLGQSETGRYKGRQGGQLASSGRPAQACGMRHVKEVPIQGWRKCADR